MSRTSGGWLVTETWVSCRCRPTATLVTHLFQPFTELLISSILGSCFVLQSLDSCFISLTSCSALSWWLLAPGMHSVLSLLSFITDSLLLSSDKLVDLWSGHTCIALSNVKNLGCSSISFCPGHLFGFLHFHFAFTPGLITDLECLPESEKQVFQFRETTVNIPYMFKALYDFTEHLHMHSILCDPHNNPVR